MDKVEKVILKLMGWFLSILIFIMAMDIFAAVIVRYVLHTALNFSE